jgi:hypothetical protein
VIALPEELIADLRPATPPFGRNEPGNQKTLLPGEDHILSHAILGPCASSSNVLAVHSLVASLRTVDPDADDETIEQSLYLWVIDDSGLRLIREQEFNPASRRGHACHTNITGGADAFVGGEVWFTADHYAMLNVKSGRYYYYSEVDGKERSRGRLEAALRLFHFHGWRTLFIGRQTHPYRLKYRALELQEFSQWNGR